MVRPREHSGPPGGRWRRIRDPALPRQGRFTPYAHQMTNVGIRKTNQDECGARRPESSMIQLFVERQPALGDLEWHDSLVARRTAMFGDVKGATHPRV